MRGLLIDPDLRIVEEVNEDFTDFKKIQEQVEGTFTIATMMDGHVMYCDDEGMLKFNLAYTQVEGCVQPFAGRLLVLGDRDGSSVDATMSCEELGAKISFLTLGQVREMFS